MTSRSSLSFVCYLPHFVHFPSSFLVSSFLVRLLCLAAVVTATGEDSTVPKCPADEFACNSVGCYTNDQRCDGVNHCADGSDELECRKSFLLFDRWICCLNEL